MRLPELSPQQINLIKEALKKIEHDDLAAIASDYEFSNAVANGYSIRDASRTADYQYNRFKGMTRSVLINKVFSFIIYTDQCEYNLNGIWMEPQGIHKLWTET